MDDEWVMQNMTIGLIFSVSFLLLLSGFTQILGRYIKVPFTILLVLVGFVMASVMKFEPGYWQPYLSLSIHPDIILYVCLPTLIFESAFAMDVSLFRHNIIQILTLAVPGLFLSTAIIGVMVYWVAPFDFLTALLLGAILSATDPVAVISLFNQLGVPKRLTVLVEGESLLNDSTAIVMAKTILVVMLAGSMSTHTVMHGMYEFMFEFVGGVIFGLVITYLFGFVLSWLEDEVITQLSLTIILAYLSFVLADKVFHVSGVMATITSGMMLSGWGRSKMSPITTSYLHQLLKLFAYSANALIFLLVGFSIYSAMASISLYLLGMVIVAMLVSRAVVIYGLIPVVGRLPNAEKIDLKYQTIMWWGGLRGAIALAIVMGLNDLPHQEQLISLVMGAVLFTIVVQGLTIDRLIRYFKLNKLILPDEVGKIEADIAADKVIIERLPHLQRGGLFSNSIADNLLKEYEAELAKNSRMLDLLRSDELSQDEEKRILFLNCFAVEKHLYYSMFKNGYISSRTWLILDKDIDMEVDALRYRSQIDAFIPVGVTRKLKLFLVKYLEGLPAFRSLVNKLKRNETIDFYEEKWGLHQGCLAALEYLSEQEKIGVVKKEIVADVKAQFESWFNATRRYLDAMAEHFPEFVTDMQKRLAERMVLYAKSEKIQAQESQGLLPEGIADVMLHEVKVKIRELNARAQQKLMLDRRALLFKVPFFTDNSDELDLIASLLREQHVSPGEYVIREGDIGNELYLILRGVIRVTKGAGDQEQEVATLFAGDFFGEMALLYDTKRTANCKAVTPCIVYVLTREDLEMLYEKIPNIKQALEREAKKRC